MKRVNDYPENNNLTKSFKLPSKDKLINQLRKHSSAKDKKV